MREPGPPGFVRRQTQQVERTDTLIALLRDTVVACRGEGSKEERFEAVGALLAPDADSILAQCDAHAAVAGNNYLPFLRRSIAGNGLLSCASSRAFLSWPRPRTRRSSRPSPSSSTTPPAGTPAWRQSDGSVGPTTPGRRCRCSTFPSCPKVAGTGHRSRRRDSCRRRSTGATSSLACSPRSCRSFGRATCACPAARSTVTIGNSWFRGQSTTSRSSPSVSRPACRPTARPSSPVSRPTGGRCPTGRRRLSKQ